MKQSRTRRRGPQVHEIAREEKVTLQLPLPLVIRLADVERSFFDLCVAAGREVLTILMENDRTALCGPKWKPDPDRKATRMGSTRAEVTLGGRRIAVPRLRARSVGNVELELPSFAFAASRDPLDERTMEAVAVGVSTRKYDRHLEPITVGEAGRATSRSSVSRRFVALSSKLLTQWMMRPLGELDLRVVVIDGIHFRGHCVLIALGITAQGEKRVLGVREGSTENSTVAQGLLSELIERGLPDNRALLFIIDGGKGIRKAIDQTFGKLALIQRCQVHKERNVLEYLSDSMRPAVRRAMREAYTNTNGELAYKQLERLARSLERQHPGAAASLREGLEDTLTVQRLGLSVRLCESLRSTNSIENLNGSVGGFARNVKRWRDGVMLIRWVAAGLQEAEQHFNRLQGYKGMGRLTHALKQHENSVNMETKKKVA